LPRNILISFTTSLIVKMKPEAPIVPVIGYRFKTSPIPNFYQSQRLSEFKYFTDQLIHLQNFNVYFIPIYLKKNQIQNCHRSSKRRFQESLFFSQFIWKYKRKHPKTKPEIVKPLLFVFKTYLSFRGCHGRDRMVVGFTTTYAISAYHH